MSEKPISYYTSKSLDLKSHCFVGLCLGGAKTDKTAMSVLEYYPKNKKLFLRHIYPKIQSTQDKSSDFFIYEILKDSLTKISSISLNAPLTLPSCLTCKLQCPGYEACNESHILWHKKFSIRHKNKKTKKVFTPYTDRCSELYISKELEEPFSLSTALNSNKAPLTARSLFLKRRLKKVKKREFFAHLSLWRIGSSLKIAKTHLRRYRHQVEGKEARKIILKKVEKSGLIFFYEQDRRLMIKDVACFESFLGALTGVLSFMKQGEPLPLGYPKKEAWIDFPVQNIDWSFLNTEEHAKI